MRAVIPASVVTNSSGNKGRRYRARGWWGVAVGDITLRAGEDFAVFPAHRIPGGSGWHAHESAPRALWRWTDGAGEVRFEPLAQVTVSEFRLSGSAFYIVEEPAAHAAA